MAKYTKQEWIDNETLINADKLNHIEDGIESASEDAITGINVNGNPATVTDHVAEIEVEGSGSVYYAEAVDGDIRGSIVAVDISGFTVGESNYPADGTMLALWFQDCTSDTPIETIYINSQYQFTVRPDDAIIPSQSGMVLFVLIGGVWVASNDPALIAEIQAQLTATTETANEAKETAESAKDAIPTKTSELENDSGYITDSALDGYAKEDDIPTKVSELTNDSGYITDSALEDYAKESDVESVKETADSALETATEAKEAIPTKVSELDNDVPYGTQGAVETAQNTADEALTKATETAESAITGINVNGTAQPVNDNIAELTIEEGGGAIEHIQVNGEEQEIVDKTVDLSIDRASVDGETLVVGDTAGGGEDKRIVQGTLASMSDVVFTCANGLLWCASTNGAAKCAHILGGNTASALMSSTAIPVTALGNNQYVLEVDVETSYTLIMME